MFLVMILWMAAIAAITISAIIFIYGIFARKKSLVVLGAAVCTGILLIWLIINNEDYRFRHRPKEQLAHDLITLPSGAVVLAADIGDSVDDGSVTFCVPSTKSVSKTMAEIWELNSSINGIKPASKSATDWSTGDFVPHDVHVDLSYDPHTKSYTYWKGSE